MTDVKSVALLLPGARPTTGTEVVSAPEWRGVGEYPGVTPAQMAVEVGSCALTSALVSPADVAWLVHCGSGAQGPLGWPVHHRIQHGLLGHHGNALEVKQYCSGGLTSWLVGAGLAEQGKGAVVCTGADNWSFGDRFVTSRSSGGGPFSDVAHATVLSVDRGFASIMSTGCASCPDQAEMWKTREHYWEHPTFDDYRETFERAAAARTATSDREAMNMVGQAVAGALTSARLSPQYITHFVPHPLGSGIMYRSLAAAMDLPWSEDLYDFYLDHGYLGVSTEIAGLIRLAETGCLKSDSIVLLLAVEYLLSATAIVLRIRRAPTVSKQGLVSVAA